MLDRPDEAADEADRLVRVRPGQADDLVDAARLLARAAGAAGGSRGETYAARALQRLRSVPQAARGQIAPRADDPGFVALRSRPEFQRLLMDLAFPEEPFAP
jgi:serine/threonine-protein kinase